MDVSFLSFEDIKAGKLKDIDIVINAGYAGSAWSGGDAWKDEELLEILTKWVHMGGTFLGVNEPSAVTGYDTFFRMAHVLGIDEDTGERICHGRWQFRTESSDGLVPQGAELAVKPNRYLTDGTAKVLLAQNGEPVLTIHEFGNGKGIYLSSFQCTPENTRLLYQLIRYAGGEGITGMYMTDNLHTECAYYPESNTLVVINNSDIQQKTCIETHAGTKELTLEPYQTMFINL